jgi:hypothetical protein
VFPDNALNAYLGPDHFRVVVQDSICSIRSSDNTRSVYAYAWQRRFADDLIDNQQPRPQQVNTTPGQRVLLFPPEELNKEYLYFAEIPVPDVIIRFSIGSEYRTAPVAADAKQLGDNMVKAIADASR